MQLEAIPDLVGSEGSDKGLGQGGVLLTVEAVGWGIGRAY